MSVKAENKKLDLILSGQIRGGKNNYLITKQGKHIPNKRFTQWRDYAILEIQKQLPQKFKPITDTELIWLFAYTPEDKRRRDTTAILDAIFHALERAGAVKDDSCIKHILFTTLPPNKQNANLHLQVYEAIELSWEVADLFYPF